MGHVGEWLGRIAKDGQERRRMTSRGLMVGEPAPALLGRERELRMLHDLVERVHQQGESDGPATQ